MLRLRLEALAESLPALAASTLTRGCRGTGQSACFPITFQGKLARITRNPHSPGCHAAWLLGGSSGTNSGAHFRRKKEPSGEGMARQARVVPVEVRVCRLARDDGCEARGDPKECNSVITLPALALEISVNISTWTLHHAAGPRTMDRGMDGTSVWLKTRGGLRSPGVCGREEVMLLLLLREAQW